MFVTFADEFFVHRFAQIVHKRIIEYIEYGIDFLKKLIVIIASVNERFVKVYPAMEIFFCQRAVKIALKRVQNSFVVDIYLSVAGVFFAAGKVVHYVLGKSEVQCFEKHLFGIVFVAGAIAVEIVAVDAYARAEER